MILKKNDRELWGIPYQGSKTKLVEKIARFFPNADHFYDLFGGGFSVSHYMIKMRKKSYKHFHYNELRLGMCELIQDAINDKRFTVIKEFSHRTTFSAGNNDPVVEKLYGNKAAIDILNSFRKEKQNG